MSPRIRSTSAPGSSSSPVAASGQVPLYMNAGETFTVAARKQEFFKKDIHMGAGAVIHVGANAILAQVT